MRTLIIPATISALICFSAAVPAQYTGPGAHPAVKSVSGTDSAKDDTPADLEGYIIKQLTSDKFLFSDGKAEVRVEIDADIFPKTPINERTRVRIRGEVEKDFLQSPEIDVTSVEVLKQE